MDLQPESQILENLWIPFLVLGLVLLPGHACSHGVELANVAAVANGPATNETRQSSEGCG